MSGAGGGEWGVGAGWMIRRDFPNRLGQHCHTLHTQAIIIGLKLAKKGSR